MKNIGYLVCSLILAALMQSCEKAVRQWEVTSPDDRIRFVVNMEKQGEDNLFFYSVYYHDSLVVESSRLGIVRDDCDFSKNVKLLSVSAVKEIKEEYQLKAGKQLDCLNEYKEITLNMESREKVPFQLIIRAYDDGVAFRYGFPAADGQTHVITNELTEFAVPVGGKAWIHPYDWNERHKPSYEQYSENEIDIRSECKLGRGWAFPLLFHTNGVWMMITEASLDGSYPATHVDNSGREAAYKIRFPEIEEPIVPDAVEPVSTLPWYTPWRTIIVGRELNTIFRTKMVSHLNPPSVIKDESWIKAGRSSWSWWYEGATTQDYKEQIRYVDFSKEMGWEYLLIDAGWQKMKNGGMTEDVVAYANNKGVGIWLWYHSGAGRKNDSLPRHRIMSDSLLRRAEMSRISKLGVKGIKVDFFDTDKQEIIKLYPAILKDAAEYKLMVNLHGATLPRGFERTYPNMMTTEAIRGAETLGRQERCDRAAIHNATVPFTRNVVGSMDYTPVTFSNKIRQGVTAYRQTTMAHQLALAVVFESGFQCFADRAEAYKALPDEPKQFLKEVPAAWGESRLLAGYPSDLAVVARRKGDTWFIGGISGKAAKREVFFELPEACIGKSFTLIMDGADKNSFSLQDVKADSSVVRVRLLENGGFAAIIK